MASLAFQPYVDKENAGSFGVRPNKGQIGGGLGKVFNKGNEQSLVTPRRALGDVNRDLKAVNNGPGLKPMQKPSGLPLQSKGLQMKSANIQPLTGRSGNIMQKPSVNENLRKKSISTNKVTVKIEPVHKRLAEDIEHMHIPKEEEDDFEDIWPKSDRISTYLNKLVRWRPPCLFGELPDSSDEEEEKLERQRMKEEEERKMVASLAKYSTQKSDCSDEFRLEDLLEPEDFEDVPLPSISLDNSIDLLPNIGPLQLKE
ncbi:uncharacterized protein LOC143072583 [Mytilus galloprovincialis]|uniref:uncharacterized protein LOC143072583 n=1 Tax=Mytilus galloprovincialis TaxID=29158 RepID=UPI003F7C2B36